MFHGFMHGIHLERRWRLEEQEERIEQIVQVGQDRFTHIMRDVFKFLRESGVDVDPRADAMICRRLLSSLGTDATLQAAWDELQRLPPSKEAAEQFLRVYLDAAESHVWTAINATVFQGGAYA